MSRVERSTEDRREERARTLQSARDDRALRVQISPFRLAPSSRGPKSWHNTLDDSSAAQCTGQSGSVCTDSSRHRHVRSRRLPSSAARARAAPSRVRSSSTWEGPPTYTPDPSRSGRYSVWMWTPWRIGCARVSGVRALWLGL